MKNLNIWRGLVIFALTALVAVGGWAAARTATMADRHPTRPEFQEVQEAVKTNQNRIIEQGQRMEDKLDKIQELLK